MGLQPLAPDRPLTAPPESRANPLSTSTLNPISPGNGGLFALFKSKDHRARRKAEESDLKISDPLANWDTTGLSDRQIELNNARRVLRMASWGAVFYLITCDILGPFGAPYSIAQIGLVPGITLYLLFGIFAIITGFMIAKLFLRLDSIRYPVRTFGDLAERVLGGSWARHFTSALQAVQLVLNCGLLCLSKGQSLSQVSRGPNHNAAVCSLICVMVFALIGMILGQVRSLKGFGLIANFSVWLNILIMVLSMGFIANSPPNFASAMSTYGYTTITPISVASVVKNPIFTQVNGVFNMVFAYGGAMIFPEIMAEMRRPRDFIKGAAMAQVFIMLVYLFYGVFIYCYQGQYTLPVAYQGVSKYAWQTIGNSIALITGAVASGLYGNIGLKVVYSKSPLLFSWMRRRAACAGRCSSGVAASAPPDPRTRLTQRDSFLALQSTSLKTCSRGLLS